MDNRLVNRVEYINREKSLDIEIVDIQLFFATRPLKTLNKDVRLDFWSVIYVIEGSGYHYIDFI
jgi:hypothetical protein